MPEQPVREDVWKSQSRFNLWDMRCGAHPVDGRDSSSVLDCLIRLSTVGLGARRLGGLWGCRSDWLLLVYVIILVVVIIVAVLLVVLLAGVAARGPCGRRDMDVIDYWLSS